jgi:hypothetical protein
MALPPLVACRNASRAASPDPDLRAQPPALFRAAAALHSIAVLRSRIVNEAPDPIMIATVTTSCPSVRASFYARVLAPHDSAVLTLLVPVTSVGSEQGWATLVDIDGRDVCRVSYLVHVERQIGLRLAPETLVLPREHPALLPDLSLLVHGNHDAIPGEPRFVAHPGLLLETREPWRFREPERWMRTVSLSVIAAIPGGCELTCSVSQGDKAWCARMAVVMHHERR